jgi:hypothetical protein
MSEPGGPSPGPPRSPRRLDWWLRDRTTGRIVVAQWPNAALVVWAVAAVTTRLGLFPDRADEIRWAGAGALIAWAADELVRGDSPFRRGLGLVVLGWQVYRLIG